MARKPGWATRKPRAVMTGDFAPQIDLIVKALVIANDPDLFTAYETKKTKNWYHGTQRSEVEILLDKAGTRFLTDTAESERHEGVAKRQDYIDALEGMESDTRKLHEEEATPGHHTKPARKGPGAG